MHILFMQVLGSCMTVESIGYTRNPKTRIITQEIQTKKYMVEIATKTAVGVCMR